MEERCVCCGEIIPEGRQVCQGCEGQPIAIKQVVNVKAELERMVAYAKTAVFPLEALYEAKGAIDMAYRLGGITRNEYLCLDHQVVREGINNPKYFRKRRD